MQLSVRKKVANGLVLFLLVPKAAATANELYEVYSQGLADFSAEDDFDLSAGSKSTDTASVKVRQTSGVEVEDPTGGDPTGGDPTGGDPTGGDPTGGDPTGGDPTGGDPTGGDPTGGDPTGGDPTGGDPTGGDPTGGEPTGGDPTGGDPTGGDPTGGDPTGGDPTGGDPTGGDPTGGDPTGGDPTGGDPSGYDPSAFDPSGYDPSGGDPSGCPPASSPQRLIVRAAGGLVTAEDGSADLFEVYMEADPSLPRTFRVVSTLPDEARPKPEVVELFEDACIPQNITVIGQNDYVVDGDIDFRIDILDEQDVVVGMVPGVNLDNDDYRGVAVDVLGPTSLPRGEGGLFLVRVANVSGGELPKSTLHVEPTDQLMITDYATALLSGEPFDGKGKLDKSGSLVFTNVKLLTNEMLIVSVRAMLAADSTQDQALRARFENDDSGEQTDDDQDIRTAVP